MLVITDSFSLTSSTEGIAAQPAKSKARPAAANLLILCKTVKTAIVTDHPVSLIQSLPICAGLALFLPPPRVTGFFLIIPFFRRQVKESLIAEKVKESGFPAVVGPDLASRSKIEVQNMAQSPSWWQATYPAPHNLPWGFPQKQLSLPRGIVPAYRQWPFHGSLHSDGDPYCKRVRAFHDIRSLQ